VQNQLIAGDLVRGDAGQRLVVHLFLTKNATG
jgi:hypothetical protein